MHLIYKALASRVSQPLCLVINGQLLTALLSLALKHGTVKAITFPQAIL